MFSNQSKYFAHVGFAALILIMLAAISIAYIQITNSQTHIDQLVHNQHKKINLATIIYSTAQERQEELIQIQHLQDPFERDQAFQRFTQLASEHLLAREQLAALLTGKTEIIMLDKIIELTSQSAFTHRQLIDLVSSDEFDKAHDILIEQSFPIHNMLLNQTRKFLEHEHKMSDYEISLARKKFHKTIGLLLLMFVLAVFACIFIAITVLRKMKQAENALFAQSTLQSIGDAVITTDAAGKIIYTNGKALSLLDTDTSIVIGQPLTDALKHQNNCLIPSITDSEEYIISNCCLFGETKLKPSNLPEKEVEYSISPIRDQENKIQGSVLAFRDITDRKMIQGELHKSQERLSLIIKGTNDGLWDYSLETGEIYFSPRWKEMLGFSEEEFSNSFTAWQDHIHTRDLGNILLAWTDCMNGITESFQVEYRMQTKDSRWIWIECRGLAQLDENTKPTRLAGSHTDITARKNTEQALFEAKEHAEVTLQSIGDAVITLDKDSQVNYLNTVAEQLSGWTSSEAIGKPFNKIIKLYDENDGEPILLSNHTNQRKDEKNQNLSHAVLVSRGSQEHSVEHTFSPINDRSNQTIGTVIVLRDVSIERTLKQQLFWQATHDSLTGLVNRSAFENRLSEAIESARTHNEEYALLYMDLDQFKVVNDTCGHLAGDELLRQLATQLKKNVRAADTLARLGGDEFGVLLDRCPLHEAVAIAQSLKESIGEHRFAWDNKTFEVGVSIGVVPVTSTCASKESLMSSADIACYAAKDLGRNRVHLFEEADDHTSKRHGEMHWVSRITEALQQDRFILYKQTIAGIVENEEHHYEILIRMLDDSGKIIPPGAFIPAAERYNMMPAIDRWVIRNLFAFCAGEFFTGNPEQPATTQIYTINLSGNSVNDADFLQFVRDQFTLHELPPERFCFEITETSAIANLSSAATFISELKTMGCLFALDDFGSGLSSFGYLKNLPVDFLKIDGQFVKDIVDDPIDAAMVKSINEIGHVMGIRTIAEFVENDAILNKLKEIGVDFAQGYGISRPEPLIETEQRKTAS
jgi:diguanylate cyclase (GGDEF)-like protein/PAS domain S-box-containing protein